MFKFLSKQKEQELPIPQIKDYPKNKYSAYWEIVETAEGKEIRFMSYKKGLVNTVKVNNDPAELARVISVFMKDYEVA